MDVSSRLSFFASLYQVDDNPELGMWLLYITIFALSIVVYKLGFAKKLPLLKNIVIYAFLALGCTVLTFFGAFLPMAEGLFFAAVILIIYKIRLNQAKKHKANTNS
ncbi:MULTISPECIES: YlaH-like family protein [Bacillaceae]|uniref:YlaH-like family protein n=1 Tax=Bacillaceae TaxID=186817 RepID=UPI001BDEA190|nr:MULTISPECIES: YlaH-like family protein [unclassified Cytobacillus]MDX8359943.1 YlaH-like family protein [Cytobacillus sp. IB215316]MDX8364915.1 YlaH-like family protein [Cytobacillus sp. IB215665]